MPTPRSSWRHATPNTWPCFLLKDTPLPRPTTDQILQESRKTLVACQATAQQEMRNKRLSLVGEKHPAAGPRTDDDVTAYNGGLVAGYARYVDNSRVAHHSPGADGNVVHIAAHHRSVPDRRALPYLPGIKGGASRRRGARETTQRRTGYMLRIEVRY